MSDENLLAEISRKLSVLISLELRRDEKKTVQDHVVHLDRFGFSTGDIAEILDTTAGTVAVTKSRVKSRKEKK